MGDDSRTTKPIVDELTELRAENAALKKSITRTVSAELAAEEASRYAESIVETVREPLLVLDADLKIVSANRNFYTTFKVTPGQTIGCYIYDLGNKQWDIPGLRELLEEVLPGKQAFDDFEVIHDFQNIGHKIMLLNACRIYRKDNGTKMILLAIEDITERRQLENLLTESEERYRRLFETASDGIVLLEKREGKITHANPATEKLLGYTKMESIGNRLQDIGILLDRGDFQTTMQMLNRSGISNYDDVPIETKTGQHVDTDIYLVDRARLVQCNIRDITDRKRVEEALRNSEGRLRALLQTIPDPIWLKDKEGIYLLCNTMFEHFFGAREAEIVGKTDYDFVDKELADSFREHDFKAMAAGKPTSNEEWITFAGDGHPTCLETIKMPLHDAGGALIGVLGVGRDITERKQQVERIRKALGATIHAIALTVETRDPYTAGHQRRVADLASAITAEMNLSADQSDGIHMAAAIHDLGKISVPAEILSKPMKLTDIEFSLIKTHSQFGYDILKDIEFPWPVARMVLEHHERMNGSGYPNGLAGDDILMDSRILSVADVVESMASHRPYRPSLGIGAALEEIEMNKGTLYDNTVVEACLRLFREKNYQLLQGVNTNSK